MTWSEDRRRLPCMEWVWRGRRSRPRPSVCDCARLGHPTLTLTPIKGAAFTAQQLQIREAVNQWVRTSGAFGGVVDFDKATRDPADPQAFLPAYDSGGHLHPNDAGYQAMANAVDIAALRGK